MTSSSTYSLLGHRYDTRKDGMSIHKYSRRGNRPSQPYVGDLLLHTYISTEIHLRVAFPEAHSRIHFRYHTFRSQIGFHHPLIHSTHAP